MVMPPVTESKKDDYDIRNMKSVTRINTLAHYLIIVSEVSD